MSESGIIVANPERSDEDIIRGVFERLQSVSQGFQVAFMGQGKRLFVCILKDLKLNLWHPIGELADCSFAFVKDMCLYRPGVSDTYVNDTMHEVTERLVRIMVEFHCSLIVRDGGLYIAVPHSKDAKGVPDGTWREIGSLAPRGIVPMPTMIMGSPS